MTAAGYPPVPPLQTNDVQQLNRVVDVVNRQNQGKVNVTIEVTLTANVATTTLTDARISAQSYLGFMPQTSNAAAALTGLYVTARIKGQATLNHANNAQTDRTYTVLIIG